ncbi:hypothetical protein CEXT_407081 [Caerostris extrusa]|uniref:Uncharacterized protein n=1 Tax=Caerostris extrusa TaxID=172846 RepID=A0AAV4XET3_CAEEX|nr:hypothetical protein CEXT_407081 [Caerostris extrusa]
MQHVRSIRERYRLANLEMEGVAHSGDGVPIGTGIGLDWFLIVCTCVQFAHREREISLGKSLDGKGRGCPFRDGVPIGTGIGLVSYRMVNSFRCGCTCCAKDDEGNWIGRRVNLYHGMGLNAGPYVV